MKLVNLEEAQANLADLLDEAQHERIIVQRNGQPVGVIVSIADYQDWTGMTDEELAALSARKPKRKRVAKSKVKEEMTLTE